MRSVSSTRSLVLLVFILASHITDVLARHHHIKLRHGRHRRQHGESYIPASFVSDTDEEETGTWGPWSVPGSCSRSCGGGVAYQTRSCQDIEESTGNESCTGSKKRFFSCNIQECPEPSTDFRAEQCAEYNNVPIEGVYYDWVPYTGGPNKCELNCMPRGERFFYRHKLTVTDGTPCTTESNDVCVQGKCRHVGCDMMLGSDAKEDSCRECGGDGSACNTVRGLLDMNDLQAGYNDILLIPEGATSILVNELRPSNNYLAIRNTSGHYYLNGNWRIDFPRSLKFAGSVFHYERRPHEFSAADIISTLGPTTEAIYIVLLYQDNNVGVNYEYSIPKRFSQQSTPDSYTWVAEEFSDCSTTCGGGIQSRLVRCVKRNTNEEVDENLCDQQLEPVGTQACGSDPCPAGWVVGNWGECSKQCGPGGEQSREIKCSQIISGGIASIVDDARCLDLIGPKDIEIQECNKGVQCPQWHIGPWKPCNRLCGKGKETRKITCYKKENGKIFALDDSACEEERPESEKDCELRPCAGVDWVVSKWSGCDDKCGLTQETRTTSCVTLDGEVYPDEQCNPETKPKLARECSTQEKCAFQWYTTQWSECSVKCGTGIQTRKVFCGTSLSDTDSIQKVGDEKCDQDKKYNDTKDCVAEVEECKGEWFAGPWSECSKPCGGGEMTRKVICMRDNKVVKIKGNCYENDIMFSIEDCNKKACGDDEVTLVEPGKYTASPEDEGEEVECEDYQDDGFVSVNLDLDVVDYQNDEEKSLLKSSFDEKSFQARFNDIMMGDDPSVARGDIDGEGEIGDKEEYEEDEKIRALSDLLEGSGSELDLYTSYDSSSDSTSYDTDSTEIPETSDTTDTDETAFTDSTESTITESPDSSVSPSETSATTKSSAPPTTSVKPAEKARKPPGIPNAILPEEDSKDDDDNDDDLSEDILTTEEFDTTSDATTVSGSETTETSQSTAISSSEGSESTAVPDSSTSDTTLSGTSDETSPSSDASPSSTDTTESPNTDASTDSSTDTSASSKTDSTLSSNSDASSLSTTETTGSSTPSSKVTDSVSSDSSTSSSTQSTDSSSSETTDSSSTDTSVISSSETTISANSDTTESSSSDTTVSSGSDTTESSSVDTTDTTVSSSSETPESSSSDTTVTSSSSETPESSSSDTTVASSSQTPGSTETTVSSRSDITESSSSGTTVLSSSETTESTSTDNTESSSAETTGQSSSSDTTVSSSIETTESSVSDTTASSSSEPTESSSLDTIGLSSSETPSSTSSETAISSSSETTESSSSDATTLSSAETTGSSSLDTTVLSSSEASSSSSSDTTTLSSSEVTESSSSDTSVSSSSEASSSSSSETTTLSSSETTESSSSDTTVLSSSEASSSSSSEATTPSSSETTESSSSDTTVLSSSEASSSSSSEATTLSSSEATESSSSDTTVLSSSETPSSSSSETTILSSSETPGSSSSDTTISSSSETIESSSSEGTTEVSSSETTESSSSSSDTSVSASSSETSETTVSSSTSTDVTGSESTESSEGTTVTAESSESESTTVSGETEITEESDFTTETDITSDITESGFTSETTESGITETDEDLDTTGQSHITDIWTTSAIATERAPRKCRPKKRKKTCKTSQFGCCYDGIKAATGPFGKGCPMPKTCKETEFGCCPDEVSPATGPDNKGCPDSHCSETLFGCCQDNVTPAEGNDFEGCPIPCDKSEFGCCPDKKTPASGKDNLGCCSVTEHGCCPDGIKSASGPAGEGCEAEETSTETSTSTEETGTTTISESTITATIEGESTSTSEVPISTTIAVEEGCASSEFGCCPDNQTAATGNNFEGCDIINTENCTASYYKCCPDGVTPALGPNNQGCHMECENSAFGCCRDGSTPAHGPDYEGCCLSSPYGCCPDDIRPAQGPHLYGCGCQYSRYGCCPDNTTSARGRDNEGCACEHTRHGCCPNRVDPASGPDFEGCPCHTYQFGCCPDGVSIARGSQNQGCGCENTEFKCCSDGVTPAKGENYAGCTCDASKYGCCPDGVEEAQGETFEGCLTVPSTPGAACALERDRGSCSDFTVKWFFDTEYGGCSRFWYGGCEGNDNRFKNQDECTEICVKPQGRDACFLPKIAGPCEGYHPTWYYDTERKQCGQFVYSGCLGNANKFKTKDECEDLCVVPDDVDPCEQPKEVGPCAGNFTRWYYNKDSDSCEEFAYGGCKGNKNNFQSQISCQQQCHAPGQSHVRDVCALEKEPGPCPGSLLRWYYDVKRKSCRQFVFGGCKGNGNKFRTYAACAQRCPVRDSCSLPREEGSCTEKQARWFFDQSENRCMPFYYTGCGGNKNNYESREACDSDCPPKIEQDVCLLPALLGDCYNYTQRWYYDSYEQRCRQFYYGGCGGNENNFESEHDCRHRCTNVPTTPAPAIPEFRTEFCFLPENPGPCDADEFKWFYDRRDGVCRQFRYGGCAGNGNNFNTAEECTQRCGSVQDLCDLPAVVGPCRAAFQRYYYDRRTDSCHEFIFGGCEGNDNNFDDKSSCEKRCRKSPDATTIAVSTTTTTTTPVTITSPTSPICSLPIDAGPCYEDVTAYYYDATAGACQAFEYGGCGGNANRFQTAEQCERLCGSFVGQDVCNIQADPGPCRDVYPKFYYDPISRSCQSFIYGGCDGNANRFTSAEECESVCLHREEPTVPGNDTSVTDHAICNEPVSIGSCSIGSYKRFYYNDERGDCQSFIYTGCGGNRNRFKSYDSCVQTCIPSTNNAVDVGPPRPDSNDPCYAAQVECNTIRCPYGKEAYVDDQDCQRCRCADLCRDEVCPEGSKCAITLVAQGDSTGYQSVCRSILKPGVCPRVSNTSTCQVECSSDADCAEDFKCCTSGCGSSCLQPALTVPVTTPAPQVDITVPYPDARPATIEQPEEPNVQAEEGGYVILKCACGGNPRPIITWRKDASLIESTLSRHSISIEGSLQIVDLYRSDAGLYTCTADNRLAAPVRIQYQLEITDPHERTSVILGEPNYRVTVTLNSPTILQCYVAGWPRPSVTWWHGDRLLPLQDNVYELQRDHSLRIHKVALVNLGVYTCQAYNGIRRPASWSVILQAPGPVYNLSPENQKYAQYLIHPPRRPPPTTVIPQSPYRNQTTKAPETQTYAPLYPDGKPHVPPVVSVTELSPEIVPGRYTVPVKVNVSADDGPFPVGSEFSIACNVDGFPIPRVGWFKDNVPVEPNDRITISDVNRLIINNADQSDSGTYRCQADNSYSSGSDSVDIKVAGIYIHPNCQDNTFFARCDLIVKGKFCQHRYYANFCCRSCTEAGQLPIRGPHINETRRKRRSILSFL